MSKTERVKGMHSELTKFSQDNKFFKVKQFLFSKVESQLRRDAGHSHNTERLMNLDTYKVINVGKSKFYIHRNGF